MSREQDIQTPFGEVGYITFKRTYARRLGESEKQIPDYSRMIERAIEEVRTNIFDDEYFSTAPERALTEEFVQTVERCVSAANEQLGCGFSPEEQAALRRYMLQLKGIVAGRFLWQMGTQTVSRLGLFSLQNCAFTLVDSPVRPFLWTMDALMLGSGVGFNIQRRYVNQIPPVVDRVINIERRDTVDADFIIPDSREGWVDFLRRVLEAHFYPGRAKSFTVSAILVRPRDVPIKGFGGVASGPDVLVDGMLEINNILNGRRGKQLRPIDCLDIMNIIGMIVVAGNVRRSAQLAIGDPDDLDYLMAKRWDLGNIPRWRAMSNNSVAALSTVELLPEFWEGYRGNGEPYGIVNLELARRIGRIGDHRYPDPGVKGANPCVEQFLDDKETCCLAELYLPNIKSKRELFEVAQLLYRVCKHSLNLACHHEDTEAIVHANMRMGIGVTGVLMATPEQIGWLSDVYEMLRQFDADYSAAHGFPISVKLTTVKPSGTLSLLAGVTPGIHPGYARFFIRRIRVASNSPLVEICRRHGYHVEYQLNFDRSEDKTTSVISFPCRYPDHAILAHEMTAVDQLKWIEKMQREWSDNGVSCTVYYKKEELPEIQRYLRERFTDNIKAVSFLLHSEHGFLQAPFEEITEEQYETLRRATTPITSIGAMEDETLDSSGECAGGACPIR